MIGLRAGYSMVLVQDYITSVHNVGDGQVIITVIVESRLGIIVALLSNTFLFNVELCRSVLLIISNSGCSFSLF